MTQQRRECGKHRLDFVSQPEIPVLPAGDAHDVRVLDASFGRPSRGGRLLLVEFPLVHVLELGELFGERLEVDAWHAAPDQRAQPGIPPFQADGAVSVTPWFLFSDAGSRSGVMPL